MRFLLGLLIGCGIGFAGAVLFAPEKPQTAAGGPAANGSGGFKSAIEGARQTLDEALSEARKARRDAEREMTERYRKTTGRSDK